MGSAFAVQAMTGKENKVKALLEWFAHNENAQKWIKDVHTFTQGARRLLGKDDMGERIERPVIRSFSYLPANLWHLVKKLNDVLRNFESWDHRKAA